jgi:hypothetical protein
VHEIQQRIADHAAGATRSEPTPSLADFTMAERLEKL